MANLKRNKQNNNIKNKNNKGSSLNDDASFFASNESVSNASNDSVATQENLKNDEESSLQNIEYENHTNSFEFGGQEQSQPSEKANMSSLTQSDTNIIDNNTNILSIYNNEEVIVKDGVNNASFGLNVENNKDDDESVLIKNVKPKKKIKKSFKQRMRTIGILTVLGIFTGCGLGVWYFNNAMGPIIDYSQYNVDDYIVSAESVLQSAYGINSNYENWLEIAKGSSKNCPAHLSPAENFILAEYNASLASSFRVVGNGSVSASVFGITTTQSVYSEKNYDGTYYTFESISDGMLKIGKCSVMQKGVDGVRLYSSSNIINSGTDAVWDAYQNYTNSDYIALAGSTPDGIQSYIISDKTIKSQSDIVRDEETGFYTFTIELDPITSVLRYAKQVEQTSGLSLPPTFSSVSQTIVIDENWNLISISIEEYYSVMYGVSASCSGNLTSYYYFDEDAEIDFPVNPSEISFNNVG